MNSTTTTTALHQKVAPTENIPTYISSPHPVTTYFTFGVELRMYILYDQDMKSNKGIFDRNSENMTRNRRLNKQTNSPLPKFALKKLVGWVGLGYWPGTRTDVALGTPNSQTFVEIARPN